MNRPSRLSVIHLLAVTSAFAITSAVPCSAETFRSGNSTTSIEQHGGNTPSRSRVYRLEDGHAIITGNGRSSDVTVQRAPRAYSPTPDRPTPDRPTPVGERSYRFEAPGMERRFLLPDTRWHGNSPEAGQSQLQGCFLQRLMERLREPGGTGSAKGACVDAI